MRLRLLAVIPLMVVASPAVAQVQPTPSPEREIEPVLVRMPGPGMWKVRKGENTLWVLGTVSPLPAGMEWNSGKVRSVIRRADAVLGAPSVVVNADIGFFGKLALAPSLMGVRANPDGKRLEEVVSPATYARWSTLKQRYIGRDRSVEQWRPMFAGMELYTHAIRDHGLRGGNLVSDEVHKAIKQRGIKPVSASATVKVKNPKAIVKEFKSTRFGDLECFEKTLDRVERDLPTLSARADAWATGDVAALARLPNPDLGKVCERAMLGGEFAAKHGMDTLDAQSRRNWIAGAETSLARHRVTFAMLPMHDVLAPGGLVAALAAKGYVVDPPGVGDDLPAATASAGAAD